MATPADYEYRVLRIPRGTDIDGAIVELHAWPNGLVTMDIRIPARQQHQPSDEDRIRDAMTEAHHHPGHTITR